MKLMCSWCLSKGRMAYLGERGSAADSRVSHAICEGHLVQLREESQRTTRRSSCEEKYMPSTRKPNGFEMPAVHFY